MCRPRNQWDFHCLVYLESGGSTEFSQKTPRQYFTNSSFLLRAGLGAFSNPENHTRGNPATREETVSVHSFILKCPGKDKNPNCN